jgi:hypothetical protein
MIARFLNTVDIGELAVFAAVAIAMLTVGVMYPIAFVRDLCAGWWL